MQQVAAFILQEIRSQFLASIPHLAVMLIALTLQSFVVPMGSAKILDDAGDDLCEYSDVSSMTSEQEVYLLESIAEADVDEYELPEVLATLERERKKTWKENRDYKRQLRVDRKFYQTPGGPSSSRALGGEGRPRPSLHSLGPWWRAGLCVAGKPM